MAPIYTLAEGICPHPNLVKTPTEQPIGCPQPNNATSVQLRNGSGGGLVLLQDTQLLETLAHFARERIPERQALPQKLLQYPANSQRSVVHAKAAG